jgi:uncharacterized damage-inducible protein DinB
MTDHLRTDAGLGEALKEQLRALLDGGQAHATFEDAVSGFPAKLRGTVPEGLPYSAWQILEHLRIAQRDILDFCNNSNGSYEERKWPEDYWPKSAVPSSADAWERSVAQVGEDRKAFERLLDAADEAALVRPFAWGDGQSLLREALLIADHAAYHVGEMIVLRRLLGAWKS